MTRLGSLNKNSTVYTENDLSPATSESNGLMSSTDKSKLDGVESGAQLNKIESIKINNSEVAPDQNKVVNISVPTIPADINAQPTIDSDHKLSADLIDDSNSNKKFVSSNEKSSWNGKQNAITSTNKLSKDLISGLGSLSSKNNVSQSDLDSDLINQFNDIHAKNEALSSLVSEFGITSSINPDELDIETLAKIVKGLCLALTTQASN